MKGYTTDVPEGQSCQKCDKDAVSGETYDGEPGLYLCLNHYAMANNMTIEGAKLSLCMLSSVETPFC